MPRSPAWPFDFGLIRNHYVGRTFIEPQDAIRHFGVKVKLNAQRGVLDGKRVVVVDDSIVRGTTSRKIVTMLRAAGATRGPHAHQLAADHRALLLRRRHADPRGAHRLRPLGRGHPRVHHRRQPRRSSARKGLYAFTGGDSEGFCDACFTGKLPAAGDRRRRRRGSSSCSKSAIRSRPIPHRGHASGPLEGRAPARPHPGATVMTRRRGAAPANTARRSASSARPGS